MSLWTPAERAAWLGEDAPPTTEDDAGTMTAEEAEQRHAERVRFLLLHLEEVPDDLATRLAGATKSTAQTVAETYMRNLCERIATGKTPAELRAEANGEAVGELEDMDDG